MIDDGHGAVRVIVAMMSELNLTEIRVADETLCRTSGDTLLMSRDDMRDMFVLRVRKKSETVDGEVVGYGQEISRR
jgi:hypothetical protein